MMRIKLWSFSIALALSSFAGIALADGVVTNKSALSPSAQKSLAAEIQTAKSAHPDAFSAVRKVDGHTKAAAARTRNNKPSAVRDFRRIGPPALYPLIELAAFDAKRGSLDDAEWRALGEGVLQALGFLRDEKASPVLEATFASSTEASFVEYAAQGLGMLCGDHEKDVLLANLDKANPRRAAAVAGLAYCRKSDVAERLVTLLSDSDPVIVTRAVRSLGYVGSSWALAADKTLSADEREHIRLVAANALIDAYPSQDATTRAASYRAVLMVEHPAATARIADVKRNASPTVRRELERLSARLEQNRARH